MGKNTDERAVLITTSNRGTFYGYSKHTIKNKDAFKLRAAQCVIYWATTKGYPQLATEGPQSGTTLSTVADMEVNGVTVVLEVTESAQKEWDCVRGR